MPGDEHVDILSEHFYRADPAAFFRAKLQLWLLVAQRTDQLDALLSEGLDYAGLRILPSDDVEPDLEGRSNFLTIEALSLQHHTAETVLRLYVAHLANPRAPWADLASRKNFRAFKQLVADEIVRKTPSPAEIGQVFLGRTQPDETLAPDWHAVTANLAAFLQHMGRTFLTDAPVYNAIKHGLGASPGSAFLAIGGHRMSSGASVAYPTFELAGNTREWSMTTQWVSPEESIRHVAVAAEMIDSIWAVGRFRCLPNVYPGTDVQLFFPVDFTPDNIADTSPSPTRRMSWKLATQARESTPGQVKPASE